MPSLPGLVAGTILADWCQILLLAVGGMNIPDSDIRELSSQWRSVLHSIDGYSSLSFRGVVLHEMLAAALACSVLFSATERYEELAKLEDGIRSYLDEVLQCGLTGRGRPVGDMASNG